MPNPHLLYFADPMCSWCWGFAPVIEAITSEFGDDLPIHVVVGGLRPGTNEALTDPGRAEIRSHWTHMHAATDQPFDFRFFDREDFVYDTEPAARAVVVLPRMGAAVAGLHCVQRAFYAEGRDVTRPDELVRIAVELGADGPSFRDTYDGPEARNGTRRISRLRGLPA